MLKPRHHQFRYQRRLTVALLALLLTAGPGCREEPAPPPKTDSLETLSKLKELKRSLMLEKQSNHVTAMNKGSYETSGRRFDAQEAELMMFDRIPIEDAPNPSDLSAQLERSAVVAGITISNVTIEPGPGPKRALPTATDDAFEWADDDLMATHTVRFRIEALTRARVVRWWVGVPKHLPRLILPLEVEELPGAWHVRGELYSFRTVAVPRHRLTIPSYDERMKAAGVDETAIESLAGKALLARTRELQSAIDGERSDVEAAMVPLATNHMRDGRWRALLRRLKSVEAVKMKSLIER
ncbi:MAG: hypothetical protein ACI9OJ_000198 [Myxococcota bacterium]